LEQVTGACALEPYVAPHGPHDENEVHAYQAFLSIMVSGFRSLYELVLLLSGLLRTGGCLPKNLCREAFRTTLL